MVQFKLSVDFIGYIRHEFKAVQGSQRLNDGLEVRAIIIEVLGIVILLEKFKKKLGDGV
jgi:hypothetical protein